MLEICNAFNRNYKDFFYHGNLGLNFPSIDQLLQNKITNIKLKEGEIGCNLSQQYILEDAINNNYNNILVLEDDISLSDNFFDIAYNMLKKTNNFDIIQFGYSTAEQSIINYFNNIYSYKNI
jgi:GR25 family glycosyltransferase involved in LPS biosynthesis